MNAPAFIAKEVEAMDWADDLASNLLGKSQNEIAIILRKHAEFHNLNNLINKEGRFLRGRYFTFDELKILIDKIEKYSIPEPNSGCWLWIAGTDWDGYGATGFAKKQLKAHQAAYLIYKGNVPEKMQVCHNCDTPECCNPNHLWLGSDNDNMKDKTYKKRHCYGESIGTSRLTKDRVLLIRKMFSEGKSTRNISTELKEPFSTIGKICYRATWRHL